MYLQSDFIFPAQIPWTLLPNTREKGPPTIWQYICKWIMPQAIPSPFSLHKHLQLVSDFSSAARKCCFSTFYYEYQAYKLFLKKKKSMHINTMTEYQRDYYCSSEASQWDQHESWAFVGSNIEPSPVHQEHLCIPKSSSLSDSFFYKV